MTRVLRLNPDAIDAGPGSRAALFIAQVKALNEAGYKGVLYAPSVDFGALQQIAPIAEGFFTPILADLDTDVLTPGEKEVINRYSQQFGRGELEAITVPNYNVPMVLAQTLEKAGTVDDTEKIVQVLRAGTWNTMFGPRSFVGAKTFGLPSVLEQPIYLSQVRGGKLVTIKSLKGTLP